MSFNMKASSFSVQQLKKYMQPQLRTTITARVSVKVKKQASHRSLCHLLRRRHRRRTAKTNRTAMLTAGLVLSECALQGDNISRHRSRESAVSTLHVTISRSPHRLTVLQPTICMLFHRPRRSTPVGRLAVHQRGRRSTKNIRDA